MEAKIVIIRHADYIEFDSQRTAMSPLSTIGLQEAAELKNRLICLFPGQNIELLDARAYVSPTARATQTVAIARTARMTVFLSKEIDEAYMGWRSLVQKIRELPQDIFPLILVIAHQPTVALMACELVAGDIDNSLFNYKTIKTCHGYVITGGKVERF